MKPKPLEGGPLVIEDIEATMEVVTYDSPPVKGPSFRSCWECNPAHEHLKEAAELICIGCGNYYEKGEKK